MGIATASSHASKTAGEIPSPSLPKTRQQSPEKSACDKNFLSVCGCAAMQRTPRWRNSFKHSTSVRLRDVRFGGELVPLAELGQFNDGQLENRAHGIADGPAQKRAAGSFADNQRLNAERDAIADQRAEIFRVRECVHGHQQQRLLVLRQNVHPAKQAAEFSRRPARLETSRSRSAFRVISFPRDKP